MPFGVTNGVAVFQRAMDKFVDKLRARNSSPRDSVSGRCWEVDEVLLPTKYLLGVDSS